MKNLKLLSLTALIALGSAGHANAGLWDSITNWIQCYPKTTLALAGLLSWRIYKNHKQNQAYLAQQKYLASTKLYTVILKEGTVAQTALDGLAEIKNLDVKIYFVRATDIYQAIKSASTRIPALKKIFSSPYQQNTGSQTTSPKKTANPQERLSYTGQLKKLISYLTSDKQQAPKKTQHQTKQTNKQVSLPKTNTTPTAQNNAFSSRLTYDGKEILVEFYQTKET